MPNNKRKQVQNEEPSGVSDLKDFIKVTVDVAKNEIMEEVTTRCNDLQIQLDDLKSNNVSAPPVSHNTIPVPTDKSISKTEAIKRQLRKSYPSESY